MQVKTSNQSRFSLLSVVAVLGIMALLYVGVQGLNRFSAEGETIWWQRPRAAGGQLA